MTAAELRGLGESITGRPWRADGDDVRRSGSCGMPHHGNCVVMGGSVIHPREMTDRETAFVVAMENALPALLAVVEAAERVKCQRCGGRGKRDTGCSLCGDSTYDHHCNDRTVTCEACRGTGHHPELATALAPFAPTPGDAS